MGGPAANRNVALHHAVRELVAHYLRNRGFDTTAAARGATVSSAIERGIAPDIAGLPGVYLDVTSRGTYRLSVDMDSTRAGADATGEPVAAFVQHRAGRPVEQAFVILELSDFATLAARAHGSMAVRGA